ncbi:hypothetical protein DOY81_005902 [Sarcophaga bullata]|nr:hypothetical protein DOY81_005902 [Sarcophaga bullata]
MSSSVFIESNSQPAGDSGDYANTSDSNLVVVYGKNGIRFDDKGLENLIEEKRISSISVIRLTSPTPSMQNEEDEAEKLEEMLRRQEVISADDSLRSDDDGSSSCDNRYDTVGNGDSSFDEDNNGEKKIVKDSDSDIIEDNKTKQRKQIRRRGRQPNATKQKKLSRRRKKDRPEIVGLRLEEFYPTDDANEIIKEALKMAGLETDKKSQSDYEFQLFVIQNDHCYTPFTSPSQMKAKLAAEKLEAEKQATNRKGNILQLTGGKQILVRKKQQILQKLDHITTKSIISSHILKDKGIASGNKAKKDNKERKLTPEDFVGEEEKHSSPEENDDEIGGEDESDFSETYDSAETDNDRDSDLDFDVNNPKGRKRKAKLSKASRRPLVVNKSISKPRRFYSQDETNDFPNTAVASSSSNLIPKKLGVKNVSDTSRITVRSTPSKILHNTAQTNTLSPAVAALPPIPKKPTENKVLMSTPGNSNSISFSPKTYVVVKGSWEQKNTVLQNSTQTHKEIVINKQVMASPKTKGFTDLTTLIDECEKRTALKLVDTTTVPKSSLSSTTTSVVTLTPTSSGSTTIKGFMPLETTAKNQLPVQISIQTHQSSSELEAEHDKQLDLINSIVQDEMQKSNEKNQTEKITNMNENIPELVKMLESTEKVLVSSNTQIHNVTETVQNVSQIVSGNSVSNKCISDNLNILNQTVTSSSSANNVVGGIDITSASLLATSDGDDTGDLPDDILQQVVELIKDDKTLQEAVEKQVFGTSVCNEQNINSTIIGNQHPPPLVPISKQTLKIEDQSPSTTKSIIQMSISNVSTSLGSSPTIISNADSTSKIGVGTTVTTSSNQSSKLTTLLRKEPIQIIRGNGRVITLPPMEAPTTRAKRRAQAQPNPANATVTNTALNSTAMSNDSPSDSSLHSNSSAIIASSSVVTAQENKLQDTNSKRRGSKENITASNQKSTSGRRTTTAKKAGNKSSANKSQVEAEATNSEEDDDDDPNKLWCICRQPHNNRFMICCDVCEDWFHGTCVSITKAMGLEMEQKGIDWTCPKCLKKQEEKKQPKITEMLIKKSATTNADQLAPLTISNAALVNVSSVLPPLTSSVTVADNHIRRPIENLPTENKSSVIENIAVTTSNESTSTKESIPPLKLQCGQIINLKDYNTSNTKRATIIQTSANSTTGSMTTGQKKLFISSGQANLKMCTQTGTPIRTITVVKQISTPQRQQHHNVKVIKSLSPITTTTAFSSATTETISSSSAITTTATSTSPMKNTTLCIVCKKFARFNSIYCSDDCIRKHAQNALNSLMIKSHTENNSTSSPVSKGANDEKMKRKPKGLFEELLSAADRKPKLERVNVYERKSGRIITGNNAPTTTNLKKWLQDNPTFEVIQPGSAQALDLEASTKKQKIRSQHASSPSILKSATSPPPLKMFSLASNAPLSKIESNTLSSSSQTAIKANKIMVEHVKSFPISTNSRPSTPKQLQKYPQQVGIKPDKVTKSTEEPKVVNKDKSLAPKRQTSLESSGKSANTDAEPIRFVVRRTLKEQLLLRIKEEGMSSSSNEIELKDSEGSNVRGVPKLSEEEVEEFVKTTELEMYNYFNRDTGSKYKAKYRSLIFNIKDRKNHTLFAKICGKLIEPKQLVRMSPEEMASQELAQWREQEAKHQLEMIKKSELDLLACAKNYVLKTHKGEEVIEGKSSDYANVDITIPVEDVVSALNKSELPDNADISTERKELQQHVSDVDSTVLLSSNLSAESFIMYDVDKVKTSSPSIKGKDREKEKEKESFRSREKERDRDKRHKSKDRHHDKSRPRKRSRSRSRSRSRERGEKRYKSSHKEEKRDREDRMRDKDRGKERTEREYRIEGNEKKSETRKHIAMHSKQLTKQKQNEQQKGSNNPLETYNLIDKILESTKTIEEAANLVTDKDKECENLRKTAVTPLAIQSATSTVSTSSGSSDFSIAVDIPANISSVESDQEPTSTVSIPTPPHDPYAKFMTSLGPSTAYSGDIQYSIISLWTGTINMVDVTSFQLAIQPIVGNSTNLAKLLPRELDVVGRIGPETVWDYISKIKRSPNKEIVVIRLIPANESETAAYKILYEYLDNRNRLGVIKSASTQIKDFYIYPLGSGKNVPTQLEPSEPVEFYDDQCRPDVLIGIIVRVVGSKRTNPNQSALGASSISSGLNKHSVRTDNVDTFTPPGSPKAKKLRQSVPQKKVDEIDIDAIIKAPIAAKAQKSIIPPPLSKLNENDADEPYSPGGSSDDDLPLLPIKMSSGGDHMLQAAEDDLKRKMEEINRQIAAQEMEIAGLLTGEPSSFGANSTSTSNVLANISIPSNLSQILASIKTTGKDQSIVAPPPPVIGSLKPTTSSSSVDLYPIDSTASTNTNKDTSANTTTSLLAKLSEAELLSMVPDDIVITPNKAARYEEPPPPGV